MSEVIKTCLKKGFLVDPNSAELLNEISTDTELFDFLLNSCNGMMKERVINNNFFSDNLDKISILLNNFKERRPEKKEAVEICITFLSEKFRVITKKEEKTEPIETGGGNHNGVKVIASYMIPSRKIEVEDFVRYFRNRFNIIKGILQDHSELQNLTSINKINGQKQNISIIGMVLNKRVTKNKNILLEVEDLTGRITLLVNANKQDVFEKVKSVVFDDILGFRCSGNNEILFVNDIVFPDARLPERKKSSKEEYAAFTADLHVGSTRFLEENFLKFVRWLNAELGSEKQKEIAEKVKYLFIVGDCVDGVGIYPNQENLLDIKDIREQYQKLAELLGKIRKDIKIILCPGQHDAVRVAEPQPIIDRYFAEPLHELDNLILVSNPSVINIGTAGQFPGLNVLMYHGASFHSLISDIEELRINNAHHSPTKVVKHILQRRHLAPTHSSVVYIPSENTDPLAITMIPDIIANGEVHRTDVSSYNNILTISCSCWQSITPYEEKVGNEPDPCKVPLLNMKTGQVNILDFSS